MAKQARTAAHSEHGTGDRSHRAPLSIFKWVAFTVTGIFLLIFSTCFLALITNVAGLGESQFVELAKTEFKGYMAWSNLVLFVKGYGVLCLGHTLLLYPVISLWIRRRNPCRWAIIWRTASFVLLSLLALWLGLFHFQPYFTDASWFDAWYFRIFTYIPEPVAQAFFLLAFRIVPLSLVILGLFFYTRRFRARMRTVSMAGRRVVYSLVGTAGLVMVAFFMLPGVFGSSAEKTEKKRMNVLILASDSLRADRLACNGYHRDTSPHINALAEKSVNFSKCFTPIGSTLESMTGFMASQYPHTHGIRQMFPNRETVERVNKEVPALASILKENGYETAVYGDWCAAVFNVVPSGFEERMVSDFDNFKVWMSQAIYLNHFVIPLYFDNEFGYWLFPKLQSFSYFLKPEVVTDRVVKRLEKETNRENPFFWTVFYSCNHLNYHSPDPYYKKWTDPNYAGPHKYQVELDADEFARNVDISDRYAELPQKEVDQIIGLYDGCTTQFDDCVGRILDTLKETGQLEDTIVIVTSDHGDDQFEPGVTFCHGITFSGGDQGNNVPFIVHVPGPEFAPRKIDRIVRNIDMAPTVLDLLDLPPQQTFEGVSLKPYIDGTSDDLSLAFYGETSYLFFKRRIPGEEPLVIPALHKTTFIDENFDFHIVLKDRYAEAVEKTKERCLRTRDFKLVYTPGQHYPIHRLYDLRVDPHCERDVKEQYPDVYRKMKKHLWLWIAEHKESSEAEIMADIVPEETEVPADFLRIDWGSDEDADHKPAEEERELPVKPESQGKTTALR